MKKLIVGLLLFTANIAIADDLGLDKMSSGQSKIHCVYSANFYYANYAINEVLEKPILKNFSVSAPAINSESTALSYSAGYTMCVTLTKK